MHALLIDDHTLFREGLKLLLRQLRPGTDIRQAGCVAQACEVLCTLGPVDLVLLDLQLPKPPGSRTSQTQGVEALREMLAFDEHLPIVVLSGNEDPDIVHEAIDAGAIGFINKSMDSDGLASAVQAALEGRVPIPAGCLDAMDAAGAALPAADGHPSLHALGLSRRQVQVLRHMAQGQANKVIARELAIAEATVKTHMKAVFEVLGVHSRTQAMYELARLGWPWRDMA